MSHFASDRSSTIPARNFQFSIFNFQFSICLLVGLLCSAAAADTSVPPSDPLIRKAPTWHPPQVSDVKAQVEVWLQNGTADAALRAKASAVMGGIGDQASGSVLLDRLAETFALADPKVAELVEMCSHPRSRLVLPTFAWLTDSKTPPLVAANMRLYYGRWLVQGQWFEEALEQLGGLKPAEVVAPAELLFYQAVTYHRLLDKKDGLTVINQLLDGAEFSPRRYVAIAYLMQADLGSLEEETLDHIARRMEDVQRRLDLGRAGPKVRKVEDGVVESLDKMIKKLEDEQNKQSQSQPNSLQSIRPAQQSTPAQASAPGDVAKKDIGHKNGWGDLPPKEREEALQQMGRDFPPHYRDAIEEYFRKLAAEESSDNEDK
jgi:hypothetical protein